MIRFQLVSDISGGWEIDPTPIGWTATNEEYDGEDETLYVYGKTLDDLMHAVKEWDLENE